MLILLPLLAWSLYKEKPHFSLVFGILLGVLLECLANYWVYGSAWFVSGSAGFSLSGAPQRFALYALLLCFAIPGGLWFLVTYRSKADKTLLFIVSIFISCYILYDYSAIAYSGWLKGSLLTSRFILPIIPIFCVFLACHPIPYPKIKRKITLAFALISLVLIPCSQGYFHRELAAHEQAAHSLNAYLQDAIVSYDMEGFSNTIRYFHPLHWKEQQLSRITHIDQFKTTAQQLDKFRLVISRNTGNAEKDQRSQQMIERYSTLMQQLDTTFHIDNDLRLEVWKCKGS